MAVTDARFALAEGPRWDAVTRRLLWVDILGRACFLGRLERDRLVVETRHDFDAHVGAAARADDGSLLVATGRRLTTVRPDGTRIAGEPIGLVGRRDRFNDGVCDARGRFLVGTVSLDGAHRSQRLLQVGADGVTVLDDDLGLSNGLGFSPDGATLYSVDSVPGTVWRRDYDHDTGRVGPRTRLLDLSDRTPDGLAVDEHGRLWIAIHGAGEVHRYDPRGTLAAVVAVPCPHTTSVAFAGDGLDRLVITTAFGELSDAERAAAPLSGSVFVAEPDCRGLPTFAWSGRLPVPPPRTRRPE
ncbi:hypothetical protein GCM10023340_08820 [Nocardioides marinquilinus]|uniref:SMP-30/Gluconolactonase/LRE-like region domain-containing protein n=1 Tax=Nocardioides marinquilinus TaxID=1210400 RepID=A0ABP9PBF8_9ACTN